MIPVIYFLKKYSHIQRNKNKIYPTITQTLNKDDQCCSHLICLTIKCNLQKVEFRINFGLKI